MVSRTTRKILRVGGSKTVAMPPDWLRALELDLGDLVEVVYDSIVLVMPKTQELDLDFVIRELKLLGAHRRKKNDRV